MEITNLTWTHLIVLLNLVLITGILIGCIIARMGGKARPDSSDPDDARWALLLASKRYSIVGSDRVDDAAALCQAAVHFLYFVQPLNPGLVVPERTKKTGEGTTP